VQMQGTTLPTPAGVGTFKMKKKSNDILEALMPASSCERFSPMTAQ